MDPDIKQLTSTMQNCNYFCTNLIIQLEIRYVMNIWVEFPGLLSHRVIGWTKVSIRTWKIFLLSFCALDYYSMLSNPNFTIYKVYHLAKVLSSLISSSFTHKMKLTIYIKRKSLAYSKNSINVIIISITRISLENYGWSLLFYTGIANSNALGSR